MNIEEREKFANSCEESLTSMDVGILQVYGHAEDHLSILAIEHAERALALLNAIDDELGGKILLMISSKFLRAAQRAGA